MSIKIGEIIYKAIGFSRCSKKAETFLKRFGFFMIKQMPLFPLVHM